MGLCGQGKPQAGVPTYGQQLSRWVFYKQAIMENCERGPEGWNYLKPVFSMLKVKICEVP